MRSTADVREHKENVQDIGAKLIVIAIADETLAIGSVLEALEESARGT